METPPAARIPGFGFTVLFIASVLLPRNHRSGDTTAAEIRDF
jgi:hypothetical protein